MAIDKLQEKIRKMKSPFVVDFSILPEHIPNEILENRTYSDAYEMYCLQLLEGLKSVVPAVKFSLLEWMLLGIDGTKKLVTVLKKAKSFGYYIFLECADPLSSISADIYALRLLNDECALSFDALIVSGYIGSDAITPFLPYLKEKGKDIFLVSRTANRSAPELQDILSGSRLTHAIKADIVNRYAQSLIGKCGYSQVAIVAAASSADSLRNLRAKYRNLFILLDGCDYPNANAKNCSFAFDHLGHGAIACAGISVTAAWRDNDSGKDFLESSIEAIERHKKNLNRYISIL